MYGVITRALSFLFLNIISFDLITTTVGWQVNKMGGDIRVVKKEGSGTLMRLCLLLSEPMDVTEQQCAVDLTDNGLVVSRITLLGQYYLIWEILYGYVHVCVCDRLCITETPKKEILLHSWKQCNCCCSLSVDFESTKANAEWHQSFLYHCIL